MLLSDKDMKTTIVNIKNSQYNIYIGRAGNGYDGYFGNPFIIGKDGDRQNVVRLYRDYFYKRLRNDPSFAVRIEALKGKILGCFCKPDICHGDVIIDYLDNRQKIIVCGDRKWRHTDIIYKRLSNLPFNSIIIEGGCSGADLQAKNAALELGLEVIEFPAVWKKYGKVAGPIRNIKMLNANPNLVIAFHDDIENSRGTKHMVSETRKRNIPVEIIQSME